MLIEVTYNQLHNPTDADGIPLIHLSKHILGSDSLVH